MMRWLAAVAFPACLFGADAAPPVFETTVLPLFKARCLACHSGTTPQGELDLSSSSAVGKGGKSGRAIQVGASDRSLLVEKIVSKNMPPAGPKLTGAEIGLVRSWIDAGAHSLQQQAQTIDERDVVPIFQMRCVVCHGKRKQEGGLDLRTHASRMKGGKSGPVLVPGNPDESLIVKRIASGEMPPPKLQFDNSVRPPTTAELETLRKWIAAGASPVPVQAATAGDGPDLLVSDKDRQFWSFLPPRRPAVPSVLRQDFVRNPIDAFLLQKLQEKGLTYSPEAPKPALLRRAYLDLTGMPPEPADLERFLTDTRPGAWERLIDRLLASPQYGERWGRYWLDEVGYSDSEGKVDADEIRAYAWRYRDYVIRSLNGDKPYDRFLTEQVAGDELASYQGVRQVDPESVEKLIATGFWRMAPDGTHSPPQSFVPERMNVIADELEVFGSAVLGLTVGCARCHNHKYDPLPQRDYYRLGAILHTSYDPYDWVSPTKRNLDIGLEAEVKEVATHNAPIEAEIGKVEAARSTRERPLLEQLGDPKATTEALVKKFPEYKPDADSFRKQIAELKAKLLDKPGIRALYELGGEPSAAYLLRRGEALSPGEQVQPGVPSVLRIGIAPYRIAARGDPDGPQGDASGRRLALARWLTQPDHPLTSRVIVNRIWMRHFGRGLVESTSNFGRTGTPPSHPELLDWLATEFVRRQWSIKAMHRLILTSTAWRQTSRVEPALEKADPVNVLLSRMPLRRMDADALHDSILKVTGRLDPKQFGQPASIEIKPDGEVAPKGSPTGFRRSVYVLQRRRSPVTMLEVFDTPPMTPNCIERPHSTVATQALQLLNASALLDHSRNLAGRLVDVAGHDSRRQVEQAYLHVLSRRARPTEIDRGVAALAGLTEHWRKHLAGRSDPAPHGWTSQWMALGDFVHTLLNSAEFIYAD